MIDLQKGIKLLFNKVLLIFNLINKQNEVDYLSQLYNI
jgi:hypothetical protein